MASRCGWMRMGLSRSLTRDSAIRVDSLYSSLASSCRRKWVDFLTLQRESGEGETLFGLVNIYTSVHLLCKTLTYRQQTCKFSICKLLHWSVNLGICNSCKTLFWDYNPLSVHFYIYSFFYNFLFTVARLLLGDQ